MVGGSGGREVPLAGDCTMVGWSSVCFPLSHGHVSAFAGSSLVWVALAKGLGTIAPQVPVAHAARLEQRLPLRLGFHGAYMAT